MSGMFEDEPRWYDPDVLPVTAVDVGALDAARAAAQQPPWRVHPDEPQEVLNRTGSTTAEVLIDEDAALIVAAVNALPDLLAEVRRGRALRERLEGLAEQWAEAGRQHDGYAEAARGRFDLSSELVHGLTAADLTEHAERLRALLATGDPS